MISTGKISRDGMLDHIQYLANKATRMVDTKETPQDHDGDSDDAYPNSIIFSLRSRIHASHTTPTRLTPCAEWPRPPSSLRALALGSWHRVLRYSRRDRLGQLPSRESRAASDAPGRSCSTRSTARPHDRDSRSFFGNRPMIRSSLPAMSGFSGTSVFHFKLTH